MYIFIRSHSDLQNELIIWQRKGNLHFHVGLILGWVERPSQIKYMPGINWLHLFNSSMFHIIFNSVTLNIVNFYSFFCCWIDFCQTGITDRVLFLLAWFIYRIFKDIHQRGGGIIWCNVSSSTACGKMVCSGNMTCKPIVMKEF